MRSAETRAHRPEVAGLVPEFVMRQDVEAYAATCEAIANTSAADLSDLRIPTLVITGDENGPAPSAAAAAIARAVDGSRLEILARCGHWTPLERPFELSAAPANLLFSIST